MWEYNFVDRWCTLCVSDFQSWFKKEREKIFRIYVPFASKPIFPIPYKLIHIPIRADILFSVSAAMLAWPTFQALMWGFRYHSLSKSSNYLGVSYPQNKTIEFNPKKLLTWNCLRHLWNILQRDQTQGKGCQGYKGISSRAGFVFKFPIFLSLYI